MTEEQSPTVYERKRELLFRIDDHAYQLQKLVELVGNQGFSNQRWKAIAMTELQQGFMALRRAVNNPEGF